MHVHTRAQGGLGTISRRDLDARVHRGEVAPDDVFWFPGMAEWGEVRHHPELFADLAPAPPAASPLSDVLLALPSDLARTDEGPASPSSSQQVEPEPAAPDPLLGASTRTWVAPDLEHEPEPEPEPEPLIPVVPPPAPPPTPSTPELGSLGLAADALVPTDTELAFDDPSLSEEDDLSAQGRDYVAETDEDVHMDAIFDDIIQSTVAYRDAHEFASSIDEVFLGAVITAALDAGRVLTDLTSDGTHHFLRFVSPDDGSRVLLRVTHLTGNLTTSRVQGHMASVVVGYGERMPRFAEIWASLGEETRSSLVPRDTPGAIVFDGDVASQYVYVQVRLYLRIDDYVERDWSIDYGRLNSHLTACVRALRIHLHGRFG